MYKIVKSPFLTWGLGFLHDFSLAPVAETNNGFGPEKIENQKKVFHNQHHFIVYVLNINFLATEKEINCHLKSFKVIKLVLRLVFKDFWGL